MARIIKRYGNRKLYDTGESRYIALEEIALWIRSGEEINVLDNDTSEDVTAQTLTQVISEEGRKKSQFLSSDLLHDLIRAGESAVSQRVKQFQDGVEGFVKKSIDRIAPVRNVRDEMTHLRNRLDELEMALSQVGNRGKAPAAVEEAVVAAAKSDDPIRQRKTKNGATRTRKTATLQDGEKTTTRRSSAKSTAPKRRAAKAAKVSSIPLTETKGESKA